MDALPDEILLKIVSFLGADDLLSISHSNRKWYGLVHTQLWKKPKFVGRVYSIDIAEYPIEEISSANLRDFSDSSFDRLFNSQKTLKSSFDHLSDLPKIKTLKKLYLNHYHPVCVQELEQLTKLDLEITIASNLLHWSMIADNFDLLELLRKRQIGVRFSEEIEFWTVEELKKLAGVRIEYFCPGYLCFNDFSPFYRERRGEYFVELMILLKPEIIDLSAKSCCGFVLTKEQLQRLAGLNVVKISTDYIDDCNEPCKEIGLFSSMELVILEKFTTVSRDLLHSLDISAIGIEINGKMTVLKGALRDMWNICEGLEACVANVERYFEEIRTYTVREMIYLYLGKRYILEADVNFIHLRK